jgi:tetratricopeptide (TPR) repeat protein
MLLGFKNVPFLPGKEFIMIPRVWLIGWLGLLLVLIGGSASGEPGNSAPVTAQTALGKATVFLAAGDYRRALEVCQRQIDESPSAASYIHLTYVYQAIDAYLEHLSQEEQWMAVEHLYLNLAYRDTEDLVDPPGGLARMAKEMIQASVRQQSDVSAAMANRLDRVEADRLWQEQARWRAAHPKTWWQGVPKAWLR